MSENGGNTVVDYAIDALRDAIREGRLVPGQRLVVSDVSQMLAVSAGPIREAIRRLTGEGLVEIVPHRGALVRKLSAKDLAEIFDLRQVVEGLLARSATEHFGDDPHWAVELDAIMAAMDKFAAAGDLSAFLENNQSFHDLIGRMAANERAHALAAQLVLPIYQFRLPHRMSSYDVQRAHEEHREIAAAIRSGDAERAERTMQAHIKGSGSGLIQAQQDLGAKTPPPADRRARGSNRSKAGS